MAKAIEKTSGAKVKKTISLDLDLARRLAALAGHLGVTESFVVNEALKPRLSGFRILVEKKTG